MQAARFRLSRATHAPAVYRAGSGLSLAVRAPRQCNRNRLAVIGAAGPKADSYTPTSSKDAVEKGLAAFNERNDYDEAQRLFQAAMALTPTSEEAAAALFNLGCAYAKQKKWQQAADAIGQAVNEHNLKLSVALKVSAR